ncbi:sulfotransferase domain-containing protein [Acuticoccus sp. MNP-M23]|uniref:sulfotransferase domain-containing protein n=1 Tax=Acuticoccus sp. MNP-M23 TaxID=3072793 RepID=UPI00281519EF|nr:sulfotransferase family 2 domain-containing protein [Acuticoccus sp. MNP-M23]WMS44902.1 sulfotransferase domain-containing protein [Acuticoccus sp. MNP-M23]
MSDKEAAPGSAKSGASGPDAGNKREGPGNKPVPRAKQKPAAAGGPQGQGRHSLRVNERIVFLHIAKCAGSSLAVLLASNFPENEVFHRRDDVLGTLNSDTLRSYRFFHGHFTKHSVDAVPGPKRIVTVLRDPRERIVSLYHFWRSHKPEVVERLNLRGPRIARQRPLLEFLKSKEPEVTVSIDNHMVRVMLGSLNLNQSQGFRLQDRDYAVETAITNLKRFNYVAFADTLDEDVRMMMPILGLAGADGLPRLNTFETLDANRNFEKIAREESTDEVRAELDRLTVSDRLFYRRARDIRHTLRCPYPS